MKAVNRLVCILPCGKEVRRTVPLEEDSYLGPDGREHTEAYFSFACDFGNRFLSDCKLEKCPCLKLLGDFCRATPFLVGQGKPDERAAADPNSDGRDGDDAVGDVEDIAKKAADYYPPVEESLIFWPEFNAKHRHRRSLLRRLLDAFREPRPFPGYFCALAEEGDRYARDNRGQDFHAPDSPTPRH